MDLITLAQARERLNLRTEKAARKLLDKLGVLPYPYGRGRSMGNRWDWHEVASALQSMRERAHKKPDRAPARRNAMSTFSGSWNDAQKRIAKRGSLQ